MSRNREPAGVTLEDVARLANVSAITVSRALNQPDKVAAKTLERVNQAIAQTGYVPNLLAGGLASRRSRLIAAVIPFMANSIFAEMVRAFSDVLRDAGYQVLLGETEFSEEREESLLNAILSRKPDGILLTGINHTNTCRKRLLAADIPIVETWDLTPTPLMWSLVFLMNGSVALLPSIWSASSINMNSSESYRRLTTVP